MTLTKAIEAAREALKFVTGFADHKVSANYAGQWYDEAAEALAALPDKPMTEDKLIKLVQKNLYVKYSEWDDFAKQQTSRCIVRALKAANVLYVEEK